MARRGDGREDVGRGSGRRVFRRPTHASSGATQRTRRNGHTLAWAHCAGMSKRVMRLSVSIISNPTSRASPARPFSCCPRQTRPSRQTASPPPPPPARQRFDRAPSPQIPAQLRRPTRARPASSWVAVYSAEPRGSPRVRSSACRASGRGRNRDQRRCQGVEETEEGRKAYQDQRAENLVRWRRSKSYVLSALVASLRRAIWACNSPSSVALA